VGREKCTRIRVSGRILLVYARLLYADYYLYPEEYIRVLTNCDSPSEPLKTTGFYRAPLRTVIRQRILKCGLPPFVPLLIAVASNSVCISLLK